MARLFAAGSEVERDEIEKKKKNQIMSILLCHLKEFVFYLNALDFFFLGGEGI